MWFTTIFTKFNITANPQREMEHMKWSTCQLLWIREPTHQNPSSSWLGTIDGTDEMVDISALRDARTNTRQCATVVAHFRLVAEIAVDGLWQVPGNVSRPMSRQKPFTLAIRFSDCCLGFEIAFDGVWQLGGKRGGWEYG